MPLTNGRELRPIAPRPASGGGGGGRLTSSGGYDLGPANSRTSNMMDAYNNLRRYRNRPQQQQQQAAPQEPAPDTRGWEQASDFEQGVHKLAEWGENISDPFGYGQKWEETKQKRREGKDTFGDYIETGVRFAGSLPFSMIGGLAMDPQYIGEAVTGKDYSNMYNGLIDDDRLDAGQRWASAGYVALDAASFIPGVGTAGTLGRTAARTAGRTFGKQATRANANVLQDAAETTAKSQRREMEGRIASKHPDWVDKDATDAARAAAKAEGKEYNDRVWKNPDKLEDEVARLQQREENKLKWSPSERAGNAAVKAITGSEHPFLGGLAGSAVEEGSQEFLQTMMEDIRGDQEAHGVENINLAGDLEAAAFGAIGGGLFHTGNYVGNKGVDILKRENDKRTARLAAAGDPKAQERLVGKALAGDEHAQEALARTLEDLDDLSTERQYDKNKLEGAVNPEIIDDYENFEKNTVKTYGGFSGTILNDGTQVGDEAEVGAQNVLACMESGDEKVRNAIASSLFGDLETLQKNAADPTNAHAEEYKSIISLREAAMEAVAYGRVQEFCDRVNEVLGIRERLGEHASLVYVKQPLNNKSPFRIRIKRLTMRQGVFVSEEVASASNADFDGDLAQAFLRSLEQADWFYDTIVNKHDGSSAVDWGKGHLDINNMSEESIKSIVTSVIESQNIDLSATPVTLDIRGEQRTARTGEEFATIVTDMLKEISTTGSKSARHNMFSRLVQQLSRVKQADGRRFNINMFLGLLRDTIMQNKLVQEAAPVAEDKIAKTVEAQYSRGTKNTAKIQGNQFDKNRVLGDMLQDRDINPSAPSKEAAERGDTNSIYRSATTYVYSIVHARDARHGQLNIDSETVPISLFDALLAAEMRQDQAGDQALQNLNAYFNRAVLNLLVMRAREIAGTGNFVFSKGFKLSELFDETTIELINQLVEAHNNAIDQQWFDGRRPPEAGPYIKHKLSGSSPSAVAEFLVPIMQDELYLSQLIEPFMSPETTAFLVKTGVNTQQSLRSFFDSLRGRKSLPRSFTETVFIDDDGSINDDMVELFKEMKNAYDEKSRGTGRNYTKEIGNIHTGQSDNKTIKKFMTKEQFKEAFPNASQEEIDTYFENDVYRYWSRLGRLLGSDIIRELGWGHLKDFMESPTGKAVIEARSPERRVEIIFALMFKARTQPLTVKALQILDGGDDYKDHIDKILKWRHFGATNNNPIWHSIGSIIDTIAGDVFDGKEMDEITYEDAVKFATKFIEAMDFFTNYNGAKLNAKYASLQEKCWGDKDGGTQNDDWFIWLRAGWKKQPYEMNLTLKIAQAEVETSNLDTNNLNVAQKDVVSCFEWTEENRTTFSEQAEENTWRAMADSSLIEIDDDIHFYEFMAAVYPEAGTTEKNKSYPGLELGNQAIVASNGETYTPWMDQYTSSLTGAMNLRELAKNRKVILGIFWNKIDPSTGQPYRIRVTDPKTGRATWFDHQMMFGLDEGVEADWRQRKAFLKANPFIATWHYPAKVEMVQIGDIRTVAVNRKVSEETGRNLKEVFERTYERKMNWDSEEEQSYIDKKWRARFLEPIHETKLFNVLWVLATKKYDRFDATQDEQIRNEAMKTFRIVEDLFLYCIQMHLEGNDITMENELGLDVAEAAQNSLFQMLGISSLDEIIDGVNSNVLEDFARQVDQQQTVEAVAQNVKEYLEKKRNKKPVLKENNETTTDIVQKTHYDADLKLKHDLLQVYVNKVLRKEKLAAPNEEQSYLYSKVSRDAVKARFEDDPEVMAEIDALFDDLGQIFTFNDNRVYNGLEQAEDGKYNKYVIQPVSTLKIFNKNGKKNKNWKKSVDVYHGRLSAFFENTPWGIDERDIEAYLNDLENSETIESAERAEQAFWLKVFREFSKYEANKSGRKVNTADSTTVRDYVSEGVHHVLESVDKMLAYDKDLYEEYLDDNPFMSRIGPDKLPDIPWQIYNPSNIAAAKAIMDAMTSEDSQQGIGENGVLPEILSALGFLRNHVCYTGTDMSLQDLVDEWERHPNQNTHRYVIITGIQNDLTEDDKQRIIEGIVDDYDSKKSGVDRFDFCPSKYNVERMKSGIQKLASDPNNPIDPASIRITVLDPNAPGECSSGICSVHNNSFLDWLLDCSQTAQEERLLKIKKLVRFSFGRVKGRVNHGSVLRKEQFVYDATTANGINPVRILEERRGAVRAYANAMIQNATKNAESLLGDVDEPMNFKRWADPLAKTFMPCVTLTFKNGDSCTISVDDLERAEKARLASGNRDVNASMVRDPLFKKDSEGNPLTKTHGEFIDWTQVDTVDMTPLTMEEWAHHIVSTVEPQALEAIQEGRGAEIDEKTKVPFDVFAHDAMRDWSERNRYCEETGEDNRLTGQRIVNSIGMLGFTKPYIPMVSVLPGPRSRFLRGEKIPTVNKYSSWESATTDELNTEFSSVMTESGDHVVYVESDIDMNAKSEVRIRYGDLLKNKRNAINESAKKVLSSREKKNRYIKNGVVVLCPSDKMEDEFLDPILEKAARSGCRLLIPNDTKLFDRIADRLGVSPSYLRTFSATGQRLKSGDNQITKQKDWTVIDFEELDEYQVLTSQAAELAVYEGIDEPYKMMLFMPSPAEPPADSIVFATRQMQKDWSAAVFDEQEIFDLPFESGDWHLLDESYSVEDLTALKDEINAAIKGDDPATVEKQLARIFRWDKKDKITTGGRGPETDHKFLALRTVEWIDSVIQDPQLFHTRTDVQANQIVALAYSAEYDRYVPVQFGRDDTVPARGACISISNEKNYKKGSKVSYRYSFRADTLEALGALKLHANHIPGQKGELIFVPTDDTIEYKIRIHNDDGSITDVPVPLYGIMDENTRESRIPKDIQERLAKSTLFVELRQYKNFDLIPSDDPLSYLRGVSKNKFDNATINRILNSKDRPDEIEKAFWKEFANGNLYLSNHDPKTGDKGALALQRLINACLHLNVSPAILFSSVNHQQVVRSGGKVSLDDLKHDKFKTEQFDRLLSETAQGIDIDTVMAYCHLVIPEFCDDHYVDQSPEEFMESGFHTNGNAARKITYNGKPTYAIGYMTTFSTEGTTILRSVSKEASVNSRWNFINVVRYGPSNTYDAMNALRGIREHFNVYSDEDIARMFDSDEDFWENVEIASQSRELPPKIVAGLRSLPRRLFGAKRSDIREILNRHDEYYFYRTLRVYDSSEQNKELSDDIINEMYGEITSLPGCSLLTKADYIRLIKANAGWTPTKENPNQPMPNDVFNKAHEFVKQELSAHHFPLSLDGKHKMNGRIVIGYIEPEFLQNIITRLQMDEFEGTLVFDDIEAQIRTNIEHMKGPESPLSDVTDQSRRRALSDDLFYADAIWNGIDERMVLEHRFSVNRVLVDNEMTELEKMLDGRRPEKEALRKMRERYEEQMNELVEIEAKMNYITVHPEGRDAVALQVQRTQHKETLNKIIDTAIEMRQMMAMLSPVISVANIGDTMKGVLANRLMNRLGRVGVGPYRIAMKNRVKLSEDPEVENEVMNIIMNDREVIDYSEARMMAQAMGQKYLADFERHISQGKPAQEWIDKYRGLKFGRKNRKEKAAEEEDEHLGRFENAYAWSMRVGSGHRLFKRRVLRNFLDNFLRIAGEYGCYELEEGGLMDLAAKIRENPVQAFQMIWRDYNDVARIAWEQTQQNSIAHETAISYFLETAARNHPILKFLVQSPGGVTFIRATVNISRRILRNVIPGISAIEYILTDTVANANLDENPMLRKVLAWAGKTDAATMQKMFALHPEWKTYTNLREAILVDLCHMTMPMFGLVFAAVGLATGAIQPPDDDDLYEDYWEWSFFGVTFQQQWWLQDLIGPILPWTCYCYTWLQGKPNAMIMLNGVMDFMNMSPFMAMEDVVNVILDPESVLDSYEADTSYYSDVPDGAPDVYTAFCAKSKAAAFSWAASFITPKFLRDIETYGAHTEVSYNRVYVYDDAGNPVYNEDGTLKTEKVTYAEAQLRRVTRNNWLLGFCVDLLNNVTGNSNVGYTRDEMPDQVIYDSSQLQFEHTMSVWDYENDRYKSDEEIEATCATLLMILDQNDDMDALWREGFYLDGRTKDALSAYLWGLYQDEIDQFNDMIQNGELDYLYLGNGDWNTGRAIASEMYESHYAALNYYEDLYYNKLRSRELNQGLVTYNRYNTTYKKDKNGEWYATGFRQDVGFMAPLLPSQAGLFGDTIDLTAGNEGSWATRSAVTGRGLYDQEGDPYRALIPTMEDEYEWKSFEELADLMGLTAGDGNGNKELTSKDDYGNPSGGWGYTYSRGGGGGGGGRGGYVRLANRNYASTSKAQPAYGYNYNKRLNPHNVNFNRPNLPAAMQGQRQYDAQLDYLRPNFETKGSREAYRRQDF